MPASIESCSLLMKFWCEARAFDPVPSLLSAVDTLEIDAFTAVIIAFAAVIGIGNISMPLLVVTGVVTK